MLCKCCVSIRGLAYFGASTHIVVGAMFFVEFLEGLFSVSQSKLMQTDSINIGTERLVYHWVFLSLGFLIFQGIDRESKTLLRRSTVFFLLLQTLTLAVRLKYGVMYSASLSRNPFSDSKSESNGDIYRGLGLSILATSTYLMILFLYVRRLEASHQARLFQSSLPTSSQTHIPLSTTNLGWYSQNVSSRGCSRGRGGGDSSHHTSTLYSPLNFFGGFNPMVWTNPGPPPPYSDTPNSSDNPSVNNRNLAAVHTTQPCSSRTVSVSSTPSAPTNNESIQDSLGTENKILNTSRPTTESSDTGDPSAVPLLDDEGDENKNGIDC